MGRRFAKLEKARYRQFGVCLTKFDNAVINERQWKPTNRAMLLLTNNAGSRQILQVVTIREDDQLPRQSADIGQIGRIWKWIKNGQVRRPLSANDSDRGQDRPARTAGIVQVPSFGAGDGRRI